MKDTIFQTFLGNDVNDGGNQRNPKMVDFINEILPKIETLASSEEENGSSNGSAQDSKEASPIPMDLGTNGISPKMPGVNICARFWKFARKISQFSWKKLKTDFW